MTTYYTTMDSPLGPLLLTSNGMALTGLFMNVQKYGPAVESDWVESDTAVPLGETRRQLTEYFAGERTDFDLPLAPEGTEFQRRVWNELTRIGFGETLSYGELATRIGNPNASRAVGLANGKNPISIIVPCHRVIGADGKLTGYGGGLPNKEILLNHEAMVRMSAR